jgi:hypothetical protein
MLAHFAKELFKVRDGDVLALADGSQRHRALVLTQAHINHGSDGKTAFGAQTHGVLLCVSSEYISEWSEL